MFLKQRKDSTDPRMRSLLQKAVRRGDSDLVQRTARHLDAIGDKTWLRSRAVVITFEECWPVAQHLSITKHLDSRLDAFQRVTSAVKQKDAAGLGALAYAYSEGDQSMIDVVPNSWALRTVAAAIQRPPQFFDWALANCSSSIAQKVVEAAQQYLAAATWGWDKACILAGAFLATTQGVPDCREIFPKSRDFPFWVALDKHTPKGKEIFHNLAREYSISYRHLIWTSFYLESAKVNAISDSPWWTAEKAWRLRRVGLTAETAEQLWNSVSAVIADRLDAEAGELRRLVAPHDKRQGNLF